MSQSELKNTLKSFMTEVWNDGNLSSVKKYVAPSYSVKNDVGDPWNGQTLDRETFIQRLNYTRNAFPDIRFDIQ